MTNTKERQIREAFARLFQYANADAPPELRPGSDSRLQFFKDWKVTEKEGEQYLQKIEKDMGVGLLRLVMIHTDGSDNLPTRFSNTSGRLAFLSPKTFTDMKKAFKSPAKSRTGGTSSVGGLEDGTRSDFENAQVGAASGVQMQGNLLAMSELSYADQMKLLYPLQSFSNDIIGLPGEYGKRLRTLVWIAVQRLPAHVQREFESLKLDATNVLPYIDRAWLATKDKESIKYFKEKKAERATLQAEAERLAQEAEDLQAEKRALQEELKTRPTQGDIDLLHTQLHGIEAEREEMKIQMQDFPTRSHVEQLQQELRDSNDVRQMLEERILSLPTQGDHNKLLQRWEEAEAARQALMSQTKNLPSPSDVEDLKIQLRDAEAARQELAMRLQDLPTPDHVAAIEQRLRVAEAERKALEDKNLHEDLDGRFANDDAFRTNMFRLVEQSQHHSHDRKRVLRRHKRQRAAQRGAHTRSCLDQDCEQAGCVRKRAERAASNNAGTLQRLRRRPNPGPNYRV